MAVLTAPYLPAAAQAVASTLTQEWLILARPAGADPIPLQVVDGDLTFNAGWSPHAQASLTCWLPASAAALAALDPRTGCTIEITAGYTYPSGTRDYHTLAQLQLQSRSIDLPANQLTLEAVGAEIYAQDAAALTRETPPHTGASEAIAWLIRRALRPRTVSILDRVGAEIAADTLTEAALAPGDDYWSLIQSIADAAGLTVRDTGLGQWEIARAHGRPGPARAILSTGRAGTITEANTRLDRTEFANTVITIHEWRDATDTDRLRIGRAQIATGPHGSASAGMKALKIERETPITKAAANAEAASVLRRAIARGSGYTLTAVSMYWLRPGHTITANLQGVPQQRQIIDEITFRFPSGDMDLATHLPEDEPIIIGD